MISSIAASRSLLVQRFAIIRPSTITKQLSTTRSHSAKRWQSSTTSSSTNNNSNSTKPPTTDNTPPPPDSQTQLANLALAVSLLGFCGFVFTYSMNAVGKTDNAIVFSTAKEEEVDPLAQLKAEAQEAREHRMAQKAERMTPEEVAALESGRSSSSSSRGDGSDETVQVAVSSPADIAQLEEEANRKIFSSKNNNDTTTTTTEGESPKKKNNKPWWRFGF